MVTGVFAFVGAMLGSLFINYVLNAPNDEWENPKHVEKDET